MSSNVALGVPMDSTSAINGIVVDDEEFIDYSKHVDKMDDEFSDEEHDALTSPLILNDDDFISLTNLSTISLKNIDDAEKALLHFTSSYEDVMPEFADVEIFLISMDSLIIELTAHDYQNSVLGGQTLVLTTQVDRFLNSLVDRGGKFKLVWMRELAPLYALDNMLCFLRSVIVQHLLQSSWASDIHYFESPLDANWSDFLARLNPSFLLIAMDDPYTQKFADFKGHFRRRFLSIILDVLARNIPVVDLAGLTINISLVNAARINPSAVQYEHWDDYMQTTWTSMTGLLQMNAGTVCVDFSGSDLAIKSSSIPQFWTVLIKANLGQNEVNKAKFDCVASAMLLAALVADKCGPNRSYKEEKNTKLQIDLIMGRRMLLTAAINALDRSGDHALSFKVADLWDGRLVTSIYEALLRNKDILPYRLQTSFATLHNSIGLDHSPVVDSSDSLLDPPSNDPTSLISSLQMHPVDCRFIRDFAQEVSQLMLEGTAQNFDTQVLCNHPFEGWHLERNIVEDFSQSPGKTGMQSDYHNRREKQLLYRWYELFAHSLEGRSSSLLVDFARSPRGLASISTEDDTLFEDGKKQKQQHQGKTTARKKAPVKSKKQTILESIQADRNKKLLKSETERIANNLMYKLDTVERLEIILPKLELDATKALCIFEQATRLCDTLFNDWSGEDNLQRRRLESIGLVGKLKDLFVNYWDDLDGKQQQRVRDIWARLGFTNRLFPKWTLDMNMVDYQLRVAGELIDIQSEPCKDPRITGFEPDLWQRKMLDVVDKNESALILAPTSAGKTFVSYYCIEKVLRQSDDDVVVYVSPTKALVNQVAGSVYARFRNKTMSGGKSLFGVFTKDFRSNVGDCQVLITVPQCLELLLMSTSKEWQSLRDRLKYVIFDEVHCIGSQANLDTSAVIWEHTLLLIPCPFLALSATIGNPQVLYSWMKATDESKQSGRKKKVALITYGERYSELELAIKKLTDTHGVAKLNPFATYVPEKLQMFGIPEDQQLTGKQVYDLYEAMAIYDEAVRTELEPRLFYGLKGDDHKVWLSRSELRRYETTLKKLFMSWLDSDRPKMLTVLDKLGVDVLPELTLQSQAFDQRSTALEHIVPLVEHMRDQKMLPCIVFNDDRTICEQLALHVHDQLEKKQQEFEESAEFRSKFIEKYETRLEKLTKKSKEAKEKRAVKGKGKSRGEDEDGGKSGKSFRDDNEHEEDEGMDSLLEMKVRAREASARFRLNAQGRDADLYAKMMERLSFRRHISSTKRLLLLMDRGIGVHHPGLNNLERSAVEILFRSGQLVLLFATSTLALGINMPCRTVVFGADNSNLTPLQFRQMSGRAGRRGFDRSGTVIFLAVPTGKIRRLLTASLATLRGNVPFTASFVLRLLTLVSSSSSSSSSSTSNNVSSEHDKALCLLRNAFAKHSDRHRDGEFFDKQLRHYFGFCVQVLRHLGLIDQKGRPAGLSGLANHLHYHEPGNLVFIYLLQNGLFHKLCDKYKDSSNQLKVKLVEILAHIFTNVRLPRYWTKDNKQAELRYSKVFLPPLPSDFASVLTTYNQHLRRLYSAFLQPCIKGSLLGAEFALTGASDSRWDPLSGHLVPCVDDQLVLDGAFMSTVPCVRVDHRGRTIQMNAFAVDFYTNENHALKSLREENCIHEGNVWNLLINFQMILSSISSGLKVVGKWIVNDKQHSDPFVVVMSDLAEEYETKFHKDFGLKKPGSKAKINVKHK